MSVRCARSRSNTSVDSICAAWPLLVTSAWRPSGATVTPQGPASPGPSTVITRPAGVMLQPDGVTGVAAGRAAEAGVATIAAATAVDSIPRTITLRISDLPDSVRGEHHGCGPGGG